MATSETMVDGDRAARRSPASGCAGCGAPLAADQRYCLECGHRRAATRVP